ncbi:MAG: hypothetical protein KA104_01995 [Candidatus Pacebacteria bacterium]|jgi:hypothetical protein|nr:hypothetical protein [Candidatus Paceibacterota bacterium]
MFRLFLILPLLVLLASSAQAHVNGVSYEKEKDGYTIDAGYGAPSVAQDESTLMDFRLRKDGKDVPFTDTWVKITEESGAVVFASGIHNAEFGGPRMSYVFPRPGTYTVSFRYENNADTLVDDSFVIDVTPRKEGGLNIFGVSLLPVLYVVAGAALGVLVMLILTLIMRKKSPLISEI